MRKHFWAGIAVASLLVSACGNARQVEKSADPQAIQNTAMAAAFTIVAQTQAAFPTNTAIPPTDTLTPTSAPSDTPIPLPTLAEPTFAPSPTLQPAASNPTADPCLKPLSSWQGPSAGFNYIYEYKPQSNDDKVVISMWVMTDLGECGFLTDVSTGPAGQYTAVALIDGAKSFRVSGSFRITAARWDIVIRNDTITALGSCYPNC